MTRTDQVLAEEGVEVSRVAREALVAEAGRAANMAGGRYSDHLRSEIRTFRVLGEDAYLRLAGLSTGIARTLGY